MKSLEAYEYPKIFVFLALVTLLGPRAGAEKLVTLSINPGATQQLEVGTNEVLEIVSFPALSSGNHSARIIRDDSVIFQQLRNQAPLIVVGPAQVELMAGGESGGGSTVKVTRYVFAPDWKVVTPEGSGAVVTLPSSTNLVTWTNMFFQRYSNMPTNEFFRLLH